MVEHEKEGSNGLRILWMMLAGLGVVFVVGASVGFASQHIAQGGGISLVAVSIMTVFALMIIGMAYSIGRNAKALKLDQGPLARRDRLNNWIIAGSGILGMLIAAILAFSGDMSDERANIFSSTPIPASVAIALAFLIGVILPLVSYYWHKKVIDEQEEAAYRAGALFAIYAFWFVAPVWWLLWRGGMLPAPNGVALYLMTTSIALIVWFWKKYR